MAVVKAESQIPVSLNVENNVDPSQKSHNLNSSWCLLISLPDHSPTKGSTAQSPSGGDWKDRQKKVHEFSTIEDFWCMYNNIHPPSCVTYGGYSLFKTGILPAWEDKNVKNGGRFTASFTGFNVYTPRIIDNIWMHVCMAMVGEQLDGFLPQPVVCGTVLKSRRNWVKIELWLSTDYETVVDEIRNTFEGSYSSFLFANREYSLCFESFKNKAFD